MKPSKVYLFFPHSDVGNFRGALEALVTTKTKLTLDDLAKALEEKGQQNAADMVRKEDQFMASAKKSNEIE